MREHAVREKTAREQKDDPDEHVEELPRREIQHREEDPKEEERRAEVLLEDHDEHRDEPHADDRQEVRDRRHRDRPESAWRRRQDLAIFVEVRGEEDDEGDLHELPWLELREAGPRLRPRDANPDPGAVHLAADDRQ